MLRQATQKTPITALYARLSKDDEQQGESLSIENQKRILETFARDNGFLNCRFFVDDGWSGANFQRPGFMEMMDCVENGEVKCVITKDLSRMGRNYLQVGMFTEITFPKKGVRFIAINDGVDSAQGDNDLTPLKNLFKNISHSGKVSNDFSLFGRFCCINRCFRCSCGKFSIVHGEQAAIGFRAAATGEKRDLPETHPVQSQTESIRHALAA